MTSMRSMDRTIQTAMEWMHGIKDELKWDDDDRIYNATKAVLQAVRDRMPVEKAVQFSAQLPVIMKGMYFDQYDPTGKPLTIRSREEFFELVRSNFVGNLDAEDAVKGVMRGLHRKMPDEAFNDIRNAFPENLRDLFEF